MILFILVDGNIYWRWYQNCMVLSLSFGNLKWRNMLYSLFNDDNAKLDQRTHFGICSNMYEIMCKWAILKNLWCCISGKSWHFFVLLSYPNLRKHFSLFICNDIYDLWCQNVSTNICNLFMLGFIWCLLCFLLSCSVFQNHHKDDNLLQKKYTT